MASQTGLRSVVVVVIGSLAIACGSSSPAAPSPAGSAVASAAQSAAPNFDASSTLNIRTDGPWATYDPTGAGGNLPTTQVTAGMYDRLIGMAADGKAFPYVATSWEQTPTSMKFVLRKDVTCNDGTQLTASAVAKSFDRILGISDPKTKGPTILGEFGAGPFTVSADDAAATFTLNLGTPFSGALTGFAMGQDGLVVCPKGLAANALNDAAFGTGPYVIASQDRPNTLTLKLRPEWSWGPNGRTAKGLPGTLVYKNVTNDTTASNLILTGGLDIARIQGTDVKRLLPDNSLGRLIRTPLYTNPMWINMNPGHPTSDPKVREAIATAISADDWNQAAFGGLGTVSTSAFAPNAPCFEPATAQYVPPTDLAKAKQVLISDGYTLDGSGKFTKGGQPLRIQVVGATDQGSGPEYLQTQLTQLGVTVDFVLTDHVTWSSNYLQPGKWDVIVPGIPGDIVSQYVTSYVGADPQVGRNYSRIHDAAIEDQIRKALQEPEAQACADYKAVQIAWLKNFYLRPLSAQNYYWFFRNPKWTFSANTSIVQPGSLN